MSGYATPPARCTRRFAQRCPLRDASDVGCVCWAQPCVHCHDGSFVYGRTCTEINRSYELLTKVPTDAPSPRPVLRGTDRRRRGGQEQWELRVTMTLGVLTVIVNACACWHGKKLCDENVFVSHGHPARPVHMSSVITVQPPQAVAGACAKNRHSHWPCTSDKRRRLFGSGGAHRRARRIAHWGSSDGGATTCGRAENRRAGATTSACVCAPANLPATRDTAAHCAH